MNQIVPKKKHLNFYKQDARSKRISTELITDLRVQRI